MNFRDRLNNSDSYLLVTSLGAALLLSALTGCGGGSAGGRSYAGAGSDWRWTLGGNGTFTGTERSSNSTVSGTYVTTSTGFQKMTVTSSSGNAPAVGSVFPGLEVPGFAMIFAPVLNSESQ